MSRLVKDATKIAAMFGVAAGIMGAISTGAMAQEQGGVQVGGGALANSSASRLIVQTSNCARISIDSNGDSHVIQLPPHQGSSESCTHKVLGHVDDAGRFVSHGGGDQNRDGRVRNNGRGAHATVGGVDYN